MHIQGSTFSEEATSRTFQKISDGIMDLGNIIKWRSILGANDTPIPWWRKKSKSSRAAHCDKPTPPEVSIFTSILIRQLKKCAAHAIRHAAASNKLWRTLPTAFYHFKSWMRRYGLKAVPTDKDGGYAIICKEHLDGLIISKAKPPIYEPISEHAAHPTTACPLTSEPCTRQKGT